MCSWTTTNELKHLNWISLNRVHGLWAHYVPFVNKFTLHVFIFSTKYVLHLHSSYFPRQAMRSQWSYITLDDLSWTPSSTPVLLVLCDSTTHSYTHTHMYIMCAIIISTYWDAFNSHLTLKTYTQRNYNIFSYQNCCL